MSLLFNMLSRLVITFLPTSKHLLISWLQSPSAVILELPKIKSDTVYTISPSISHEVMGPDDMILVFWMLNFKPTFSLSSFTFIKRQLESYKCTVRHKAYKALQKTLNSTLGLFLIIDEVSGWSPSTSVWEKEPRFTTALNFRHLLKCRAQLCYYCCLVAKSCWVFAAPWTVARQAPLFIGISQVKILEWVPTAFSRGSFQPRNRTRVSCLAGRFSTPE